MISLPIIPISSHLGDAFRDDAHCFREHEEVSAKGMVVVLLRETHHTRSETVCRMYLFDEVVIYEQKETYLES